MLHFEVQDVVMDLMMWAGTDGKLSGDGKL